jgi:hypothetical protein
LVLGCDFVAVHSTTKGISHLLAIFNRFLGVFAARRWSPINSPSLIH